MADQTTDSTSPAALVSTSSPKKENTNPVDSKLTELSESRAELLNRIQNLKQVFLFYLAPSSLSLSLSLYLIFFRHLLQPYISEQDLQSWRGKLDTQVQVYREELSGLKKTLNLEVEQLREEFKDLKTTLNQQQDDVSASLKSLGLQENSKDSEGQIDKKSEVKEEKVEPLLIDENGKEAEH
uniref:Uncharacterized protein n=1 Tax=Brassica campestris TaxID=3711 RepID=A0A3P5ZUJ2_BRACM|nr:unnamed protein product [Brassica rapa]